MVRLIVGVNDLATTHPKIASQLIVRPGEKNAFEMTAGSDNRLEWIGECGHVWKTRVSNRAYGYGCPYCARQKVLAGFNDLATTNPAIAHQLIVRDNEKTAQETMAGSGVMREWVGDCSHTWKTRPKDRVRGDGCPYCAGQKVLIGFNDLATTHPLIAKELIIREGDKTPQELTAGSSARREWLGSCGHTWKTIINHRRAGKGCPTCATGKTERQLVELITKKSGFVFVSKHLDNLPRRLRKLSRIQIDGINEDLKMIVEFDGEWTHGEKNPEGKTYNQKLNEDADTSEVLLNAGYKLIRFREAPLKFITVNPEHLNDSSFVDNLYQVSFKNNGYPKSKRDDLREIVKSVIQDKADWFMLCSS